MENDLKRYDLYGWDYELINPLREKEITWYVRFARMTRGPVLELACGTGRLIEEVARAGFQVDGIDLARGMLEAANCRMSQLSTETRSLIQLHGFDMQNFCFDKEFGLIILADNSFRELKTCTEQISCLQCVHKHLRFDGRFLVTERRFDPERFAPRDHVTWSSPITHPVTNDVVQRKVVVELSEDGKWIRGSMVYRTQFDDQTETLDECPFEAPILHVEDYLSLFSHAGFETSVFIDYEEIEDDGKGPILCFVCKRCA